MLLRMSFLELERQRRVLETAQLQARSIALQVRIEQIDREKAALRQTLDGVVEPTVASAKGVAPPVRRPAAARAAASPSGIGPAAAVPRRRGPRSGGLDRPPPPGNARRARG